MPTLHPKAQAIVERFAARDFSQQRLDKPTVERAIGKHLEVLEVPQRPVRWFADAMSAIKHMTLWIEPITGSVSDALARFKIKLSHLHVDSEPRDAAWVAEHAARTAATVAGKNALWNAAWTDGHTSAWRTLRGAAQSAAWDAILDRAGDDAETLDQSQGVGTAALLTVPEDATRAAARAVAAVNALGVFPHPTQEKLSNIWLGMVEAVDAGLAAYWITRHEIICVPQPVLSIDEDLLHSADGPAVEWSSGERYWFWHGSPVPAWVVEDPGRITVDLIRGEPDGDLRRCLLDRFGIERFPGAKQVCQSDNGALWRCTFSDDYPYVFWFITPCKRPAAVGADPVPARHRSWTRRKWTPPWTRS